MAETNDLFLDRAPCLKPTITSLGCVLGPFEQNADLTNTCDLKKNRGASNLSLLTARMGPGAKSIRLKFIVYYSFLGACRSLVYRATTLTEPTSAPIPKAPRSDQSKKFSAGSAMTSGATRYLPRSPQSNNRYIKSSPIAIRKHMALVFSFWSGIWAPLLLRDMVDLEYSVQYYPIRRRSLQQYSGAEQQFGSETLRYTGT